MDFFVAGIPYPKHKAGGAVEEAERWTSAVIDATKTLPAITYPCIMSLEYQIPSDRFTLGSPYGPDLDNLTKRLLDSLKPTVLKNCLGEDGCIMDLRVSKRVVKPGAQVGVRVTVEPLREEVNNDEFLYFAYGSNMQYQRLKERVGLPKRICNTFLPNYRFRNNKKGDDGSGKANIEWDASSHNIVWGVLWSIPETSRAKSNEKEGFYPGRHDSHYKPEQIIVFDEDRVPWRAMTYVACHGKTVDEDLPVHGWYHNYICSGAVENILPTDYIDRLKQIQIIDSLGIQ